MNLQDIEGISEFKARMDAKRHQQAEASVAEAFRAMSAAISPETGGDKQAQLLKALDLFSSALQFHRTNPEIYIGLGYISMVLQQFAQARNYLQEGQRLAPDHPDFATMLDYLEQRVQQADPRGASVAPAGSREDFASGARATLPPVATPAGRLDFDGLYQETADSIQKLTRRLMTSNLPHRASADANQIAQVVESQENWQKIYADLNQRIKLLDAEMDVTELQQKLKPLEIFLNRCQRLLRQSAQLETIRKDVRRHQIDVFAWNRELANPLPPERLQALTAASEALLDHLDLLADQLDELEKQADADHIINEYERLVESSQIFLEMLEEQT